jgi:hydroxyacylglutathione hydrolase
LFSRKTITMAIKYQIVPVTPFEQNCTLLWCDETMQAAVVDPGGDLPRILDAVKKNGVVLEKILVTHGHIDHAGGVADLAERLSLPVEGPQREDQFWIDGMPQQSRVYGFPPVRAFTPERWLEQGDSVQVGNLVLEVLHCPGHTPGHVVFFNAAARLALVGDVLFKGSIGRTDFPKGDFATLIASIHDRLWPLGDDVTFISGHGPMSTFGAERQSNPFCGD